MAASSSCLSTKISTRISKKIMSPNLAPLGRFNIRISRSLAFKQLQLDHLIAKSHLAPHVSTGLEKENTVPEISKTQTSKTSHVKFQLQKECKFGDEMFLVGDHPLMGLWNPANAIPMNWSTGHIWNVELDVPIETTMQFKYVLKQDIGEMLWQPGPDRIFKSWESKTTVVISEDWENPEAQKITEEQEPGNNEPMPNVDSNALFSPDTTYVMQKRN